MEIMSIKGGRARRLMENSILNFHFDLWMTSLRARPFITQYKFRVPVAPSALCNIEIIWEAPPLYYLNKQGKIPQCNIEMIKAYFAKNVLQHCFKFAYCVLLAFEEPPLCNIGQFFTLLPNMCIFTLLCVKIIIFVNFYTFECKS